MSAETIVRPEVIDEWAVIDRWWAEDPVRVEWVEVQWGDRRVVMVRRDGDHVWRVHRPVWGRRR